jgi:integrase
MSKGTAAIANKRVAPPETRFLDRDEIETLFRYLPSSGGDGLRDRVLLLFLYYNTGARVQNIVELCVKNLELVQYPPQIRHPGRWVANISKTLECLVSICDVYLQLSLPISSHYAFESLEAARRAGDDPVH